MNKTGNFEYRTSCVQCGKEFSFFRTNKLSGKELENLSKQRKYCNSCFIAYKPSGDTLSAVSSVNGSLRPGKLSAASVFSIHLVPETQKLPSSERETE